jgi:hypothetical protein
VHTGAVPVVEVIEEQASQGGLRRHAVRDEDAAHAVTQMERSAGGLVVVRGEK